MRGFWILMSAALSACGATASGGGGGDATGGGSVVGVNMSPGNPCGDTNGTHCYDGKVMTCRQGAWSMVENCAPMACLEPFTGSGACGSASTDTAGSTDAGKVDAK